MHRAIEQFASDVYWGDLDVLLLDLPPGTGDVAISVAQLLPTAKMLVVTTPQQSAASVAERVGSLARSTEQEVAGVIENMARSEEHTSELQSRGHLVCRLLLEKKKKHE